MDLGKVTSIDPQLTHALKRHLESLKRRLDGHDLHSLIEYALNKCSERGYDKESSVAYLSAQLSFYATDEDKPAATRVRARLIQQHLSLFLPGHDKTAVNPRHANVSPITSELATVPSEKFLFND